jgi:hypothetical protein
MNDDFKEELKDCYAEIERLREANEMMLTDIRRTDVDMLAFKARIEQLEAALRRITDGPWPDVVDTPEAQCRFDEDIARAALEDVHSIGHKGGL